MQIFNLSFDFAVQRIPTIPGTTAMMMQSEPKDSGFLHSVVGQVTIILIVIVVVILLAWML